MKITNNTAVAVLIADISDQPVAIPASSSKVFNDTPALNASLYSGDLGKLLYKGTVSIAASADMSRGVDAGTLLYCASVSGFSGLSGVSGFSGSRY